MNRQRVGDVVIALAVGVAVWAVFEFSGVFVGKLLTPPWDLLVTMPCAFVGGALGAYVGRKTVRRRKLRRELDSFLLSLTKD